MVVYSISIYQMGGWYFHFGLTRGVPLTGYTHPLYVSNIYIEGTTLRFGKDLTCKQPLVCNCEIAQIAR